MPTPSLIVPVILSGGSGTRLWPVSRESYPKQLWPLISERTMIQETALRAVGAGFAPPIVVCIQEHRFLIAEQLRAAGIAGARVVLEPVGRNSAPAILAAALLVAETDPDSVLWMMAADHAIADRVALEAALALAVQAARAGHIVTFGMRPTAPETGYGYIEQGAPQHPPRAPSPSSASWRSRTLRRRKTLWRLAHICGIRECSSSPPPPSSRRCRPMPRTCWPPSAPP